MKSRTRHANGPLFAAFFALVSLFASCTPSGRKAEASAAETSLKIASMAPSCTTILAALGLADSIVAIDTWSAGTTGLKADIPQFDMMKPDVEQLAATGSTILFVSTMTQQGTSQDPFKPLSDAGIQVVYIPTSKTLADIGTDVARIAKLVGREAEGRVLTETMNTEIEKISAVARTIPENKRRSVIFEISSAPSIYSFGRGVYLNELLEAAGAINALGNETGWIAVGAETIVAANPDVILTNVGYLPDPVAEIKGRPGWDGMKAVKNGHVYGIDNPSSAQPTPNVVKALREIAEAVYPEYFR